MRSHAIANGVFVAAVNRVGREGEHRVLGRLVRRRPQRQPAGQGLARPRGNADRRVRARQDRRRPHPLAVPPRPADRRVRRSDEAVFAIDVRLRSNTQMESTRHAHVRSAIACPPSGSRTPPPGSPGRISEASWPGKFEPIPPLYRAARRKSSPRTSTSTSSPAATAFPAA